MVRFGSESDSTDNPSDRIASDAQHYFELLIVCEYKNVAFVNGNIYSESTCYVHRKLTRSHFLVL